MGLNKKVGSVFLSLTEVLHRNISIKLSCLFLALVLYVFVSFSEQTEKIFVKKLQIVGLREDLMISNSIPENIKVIVKDKKKVINKLSEDDFYIRINLAEVEKAENSGKNIKVEYNIPKNMASFFSSITIIPDTLEVDVEAVKEKSVRLSTPTAGTLRPGYYIKERKITPYDVRIHGPESIVDAIKLVETERVDITDEFESFERHVRINCPDPKVKLQGVQNENAVVYFVVARKVGTKTLAVERVYLSDLNQMFSGKVTNAPVSLTLTGSEAAIAALKREDIVLSIDCSNIVVPGAYSYKNVDVALPGGISMSAMNPKMIDVTVTLRNEPAETTAQEIKDLP